MFQIIHTHNKCVCVCVCVSVYTYIICAYSMWHMCMHMCVCIYRGLKYTYPYKHVYTHAYLLMRTRDVYARTPAIWNRHTYMCRRTHTYYPSMQYVCVCIHMYCMYVCSIWHVCAHICHKLSSNIHIVCERIHMYVCLFQMACVRAYM